MTAATRGQIHFFEVDGGGVLFHEPRQRFYGLNETAAFCWLALSDGLDEAPVLAALAAAGASPDEAETWWSRSLDLFRAEGLLHDDGVFEADQPPARSAGLSGGQPLERIPHCAVHRRYRVFDLVFRVGFTNEASAARTAGMLAGLALPPEGPADFEITVIDVEGRILVARDGVLTGVAPGLDGLAARLEQALLLTAIDAAPHLLALHAGFVARGDCGLLLPGPSGSGKTTLVASLAARGWTYGTDETVLLAPEGKALHMAPLSACIKEGSWPILAESYPGLVDQPIQERIGRRVRYLPPPGQAIETGRASHVIFPSRVESIGAAGLRALSAGEGMERLLAECVSVPQRIGAPEAARLVAWARALRFFDLAFADLSDATAAIETLIG